MAERASGTDEALKKLADQLTCSICLDTYTTPKLLLCFHVFCEECLQKLARRVQQGSLTCPNCRKETQIPPDGIPALQPAFHIHHLFEIRDALQKMKMPQQMQCEKCNQHNANSYCRTCGNFICDTCKFVHTTWASLSSHEVVSLGQLAGDMTKLVPPKKTITYCTKHPSKQADLYCESCEQLICRDCIVRVHRDHQYDLIAEAYPKHKEDIISHLQPVEEQLGTLNSAIESLDARCQQIVDQRTAVEGRIHESIEQLHSSLQRRKTELVSQLGKLTQQKLKGLAAQRDQFELFQTRLSSCLNFVKESLRTGSQGEVLGMKTTVVKQIQEVTAEFQPEALVPKEQADLQLSFDTRFQTTCQQFGQIDTRPVIQEMFLTKDEQIRDLTQKLERSEKSRYEQ